MDESGEIKLDENLSVTAWFDRRLDMVNIAVRHYEGKTKRGGWFKLSLEALHRMKEGEEFPVLALMTPDTDALFE